MIHWTSLVVRTPMVLRTLTYALSRWVLQSRHAVDALLAQAFLRTVIYIELTGALQLRNSPRKAGESICSRTSAGTWCQNRNFMKGSAGSNGRLNPAR